MINKGRWRASERGAVLIHVAVSLLVITAFSAFVIDYGIFWVSRSQIQNAADAGALAGAIARAFDNYSDLSPTGAGKQAALAVSQSNRVWLEPPSVDVATDISYPECAVVGGGGPAGFGAATPCVRVDAYRTVARGSALPTFFGRLVGVTSQDVRATATAQVVMANLSDCLKPLAIADRWTEITNIIQPWPSSAARFNKYNAAGALLPPLAQDRYTPPTATEPGGYQFAAASGGLGFPLRLNEAPQPRVAIGPGQYIGVDLGGPGFQANMEGCNGIKHGFGESVTPLNGSVSGTTIAAVNALIALDASASWNPTTGKIQNSCAASNPPCAPFSPRLVALPVFNLSAYEDTRWPGQTLNVQVVNIIGFFIERVTGAQIEGRIAFHPGLINTGADSVAYPSSFLRTAMLVR